MPVVGSTPWYLQPGIMLLIATRDAHGRPRISRALAARRSADGAQLTVFVAMPSGLESLDHISANGVVAVSFARPTDYRSVQLKGSNAQIVPMMDEDRALILANCQSTFATAESMGVPRVVLDRLLSPEGAVAISFTPEGGWDQTPGPDAGREVQL